MAMASVVTARLLVEGLTSRESLADYRQRGGYSAAGWDRSAQELLDLVEEGELRGRGGSQSLSARKWRAVAAGPGPHVLLINAAESEPASHKDHTLLYRRPHLVLEGALLAARAVGAEEMVCYLHTDPASVRESVETAWRELRAAGGRWPRFRIVTSARSYVAGEQSAAIQRVNGKAALPTFKPPRAHERGVGGRPTLVHNVETLANVPGLARDGAAAFSAQQTMLATLSGAVRHPGVYEVPAGVPLAQVLEQCGGGTPGGVPVQAVLPGGYFAGWLSGDAVRQGVTLDDAALKAYGAALGSAAITVVSDAVCGLSQAVALLHFFARESARQCGPCEFGTQAMAQALERMALGAPRANDAERLRRYAEVMLPGRGACGHLDGATNVARTALRVFAQEIAVHERHGGCGRPTHVILPGLEHAHVARSA